MPKLVKRGETFAVRYYDPIKRCTTYSSFGTGDAGVAERLFHEWCLAKLANPETLETATIEGLLGSFYAKEAKKYPSKYVYKSALQYAVKYLPALPLSQFKRVRQEAFVRQLREDKLAEGTIKRLMAAIKTAVNYAYERDLIPPPPAILSVSDDTRRDRPLTDDELKQLISACKTTSDLRYVQLAILTGARPNAILGLTKAQFDFEHHILRLLPFGEKQVKQKPKPTIPMPKALESLAKTWEDGFVVHSDQNERLNTHKYLWERISKSLPDDIVAYDIRHTVATELRRQGVPEWDISGYLGHQGPGAKTTSRYAHYRPEFMRAAADAIDRFWERISERRDWVGSRSSGDGSEDGQEGRRDAA